MLENSRHQTEIISTDTEQFQKQIDAITDRNFEKSINKSNLAIKASKTPAKRVTRTAGRVIKAT